ncbi:MAG: metallophosphoesterase [Acidimicrobiia bacterium]|nr:metallophosphoesterase [Acidimicrobiia bacterium]MDH5236392.1 metallophosphoesterase [Acidimicrobiia bacterium]
MRLRSPITRPLDVEVFAVGATDAQLCWRGLGRGAVTVEHDGAVVAKAPDAVLGTATVDDLRPGSSHGLTVRPDEGPPRHIRVDTLDPPPGAELGRFATLSDLHLGATSFGLLGLVKESSPVATHPHRCAQAAVAEAVDWGAERLYLKGDLTHKSRPEDWKMAGHFLDALPLPHHLILGNHDVQYTNQRPPADAMAEIGHARERIHVVDHPGLRVILVDFSKDTHPRGIIGAEADLVLDAATVDTPVLLATHFHFHRSVVPWFWPLGIGYRLGHRFLDRLRDVNPRVVVTTGHTHRNRAYSYAGVRITEVGSPKDYPGVWAGYAIYEGGLVQTVRRVAHPDALAWTDRTRRAVAGVWGLWSPGTLAQRSLAHHWD